MMNQSLNEVFDTLDGVISSYQDYPIDLLNIGDGNGEYTYLVNACRSYQRTIADVVGLFPQRQSNSDEPVRILEIGAYLGVVSLTLSRLGFSVTACDIPEFMQNKKLQESYKRDGVMTLSANLRDYKIPAPSEEFDLVIMCETLEHLNFNPVPVLLEINRVLRKGGVLYLSLPNLASLVNRVKLLLGQSIHNPISDFFAQLSDKDNMIVGLHWREYTGSELVEFVKEVGFQVDKHYYFTSHRPSLIANPVYRLFPSVRPNQTLWATKLESMAGRFDYSRLIQYSSAD